MSSKLQSRRKTIDLSDILTSDVLTSINKSRKEPIYYGPVVGSPLLIQKDNYNFVINCDISEQLINIIKDQANDECIIERISQEVLRFSCKTSSAFITTAKILDKKYFLSPQQNHVPPPSPMTPMINLQLQ
jgi:hypothetical protein